MTRGPRERAICRVASDLDFNAHARAAVTAAEVHSCKLCQALRPHLLVSAFDPGSFSKSMIKNADRKEFVAHLWVKLMCSPARGKKVR